ncbi:hypothetical protein FB451DRAFT_1549739 [Mycena latifolia]|nr:hypothetical protein FB451DRAFT_1549739 [Mycena latifolia]
MCHIIKLPTEAIDWILDNIDDTRDLLCLAFTCKDFYPQVVPCHSHWRAIELPFNITSWNTLLSQPGRLRRLRTLHIGTHNLGTPRPPLSLVTQLLPESHGTWAMDSAHDTLIELLRQATNLTKLRISLKESGPGFENIFWRLFPPMPSLELLEIQEFKEYNFISEFDDPPLPLLRHFEFRSCVVRRATGARTLPPISASVYQASSLVSLTLILSGAPHHSWFSADELFAARWPHLKKLNLAAPFGNPDVASAFFCAHPTLEDLSLVHTEHELLIAPVPHTILPRLRLFSGSASQLISLLGPTDSSEICPLEDIRLDHPTRSGYAVSSSTGLAPSPLTLHLRRITTLVHFEDCCRNAILLPAHFKLLASAICGVEILSLPDLVYRIQRHDEPTMCISTVQSLGFIAALLAPFTIAVPVADAATIFTPGGSRLHKNIKEVPAGGSLGTSGRTSTSSTPAAPSCTSPPPRSPAPYRPPWAMAGKPTHTGTAAPRSHH